MESYKCDGVENKLTIILDRISGYMAPEYAMEGLFSVKSDVFSFGVIILEIISGKRNGGFFLTEHAKTLIEYVSFLISPHWLIFLLKLSLAPKISI